MKKIILWILCILICSLDVMNANVDRPATSYPWAWRITAPYNVVVKIENIACNKQKEITKNIFSVLNARWCSKGKWEEKDAIRCTGRISGGSTLIPIQLSWSYAEILKKMNAPQWAIDQVFWNYTQEMNVQIGSSYTLTPIDGKSWWSTIVNDPTGGLTHSFGDEAYPLLWWDNTIKYSDESECITPKPKVCEPNIGINSNTWDSDGSNFTPFEFTAQPWNELWEDTEYKWFINGELKSEEKNFTHTFSDVDLPGETFKVTLTTKENGKSCYSNETVRIEKQIEQWCEEFPDFKISTPTAWDAPLDLYARMDWRPKDWWEYEWLINDTKVDGISSTYYESLRHKFTDYDENSTDLYTVSTVKLKITSDTGKICAKAKEVMVRNNTKPENPPTISNNIIPPQLDCQAFRLSENSNCKELAAGEDMRNYSCFANSDSIELQYQLDSFGSNFPGSIKKWVWYRELLIKSDEPRVWTLLSTNTWSMDPRIVDKAPYDFSVSDNVFKDAWVYTLEFKVGWTQQDRRTHSSACAVRVKVVPNNEIVVTPPITPVVTPNPPTTIISVPWEGWTPIGVCHQLTDEYWNDLNISSTNIKVESIAWMWIYSNQKTSIWDALTISWKSLIDGKICFNINSIAPAKKKLWFNITVPKHDISSNPIPWEDKTYKLETPEIEFKKLFIGELEIEELIGEDEDKRTMNVWSGYTLFTKIIPSVNWYNPRVLQDSWTITFAPTAYVANNQIKKPGNKTSFNFNYSWTTTIADETFSLEQRPWVTYKVWTVDVIYRLSQTHVWNDDSPLTYGVGSEFMWVEIIGTYQWQWKQEITWQDSNVSDIMKMWLRSDIRRDAYQYIRNMSNGQTLNNVHYIEWDTSIGWTLPYETLIVKNGNVTISSDLNITNKSLWIIVLQDNFNILDNTWWNIIVSWTANKLNAVIYADGWIIPWTRSGNQLFLNWALFTRNTIWGSIWAENTFILPGWQTTNNHDLAKRYDLNHIRSWNNWWSEVENATFVIKYDSSVQSDPPKLFGK